MTERVVAIDGVLGSGKTTVARRVADRLELDYLDTGAMYRCVALACLLAKIDLNDAAAVEAVARAATIEVARTPDGTAFVMLEGDDVTSEIRTPDVAKAASTVATNPGVRAAMVDQQRAWAKRRGGGVLEGRDIATVVFPDALAKIFLTADVDERARRRHAEQPDLTFDEVKADLIWRDEQDSTREADPLKVADGATVIDTTGKTVDQVVDETVAAVTSNESKPARETNDTNDTRATQETKETKGSVAKPMTEHVYTGPTKGQRTLFMTLRALALGILKLYTRISYEGLENVPKTGAYIVAPVHRSYIDFLTIPGITRRRIRYLGKESLWKYKAVHGLWDTLGGIKVERGTTDRESMRLCLDTLAAGEPIVVFPEGTRKEGLVVEPLFDGAAYMAVKQGVPIVPIGIGGSDKVMGRGSKFPKPRKICVIVGPPMNFPPADKKAGRSVVRGLTSDLQVEIQRLYDKAQQKAQS